MQQQYRMRKNREFQWVFRRGKASGAGLLTVVALRTRAEVHVGICVNKKYGGAVQRNRIKRRLKEAVRPLLPGIAPGWRLVFIPRPAAADASFTQLCAAVERGLQRAGVYGQPLQEGRPQRNGGSRPH